jgi:hypothetical protein
MLAAGLLRRRKGPAKSSWSGILPTALTGWRLYQKFGPTLQPLILKFLGRKRRAKALAEDRTPAANI